MMQMLHIEASPSGEHSTSSAMASAFLDTYGAAHPNHELTTLNVWSETIPIFGPVHSAAKFAPLLGEKRSPEQDAAWREVEETVRHFDAADKVLISCPMWNFSIPHALKNYIDLLVQPILSFGIDRETGEHIGMLRDRPVQLLLTRSSIGIDDPHDFQLPYLEHILGFMGLKDVRSLVAGATTKAPDDRRKYIDEQCSLAREAAKLF